MSNFVIGLTKKWVTYDECKQITCDVGKASEKTIVAVLPTDYVELINKS